MKLKVLASGSEGNCYLLENEDEALVLDCGVPFSDVKIALDFNITKIVGCLVSHSHKDHSRYAHQYEKAGIKVLKPYEKLDDFGKVQMGKFTIRFFSLEHDVCNFGFLIEHDTIGKLLYATDTEYIRYKFKGLNHILVEANYTKEMLLNSESEAKTHILTGHMEIETTCRFLKTNKSEGLQNVVLMHLSKTNGNREMFLDKAQDEVNCPVFIADRGLEVDLTEVPF